MTTTTTLRKALAAHPGCRNLAKAFMHLHFSGTRIDPAGTKFLASLSSFKDRQAVTKTWYFPDGSTLVLSKQGLEVVG